MLRWLDCVHRMPSSSQTVQNSCRMSATFGDESGMAGVQRDGQLRGASGVAHAPVAQVEPQDVRVVASIHSEHKHMFASVTDGMMPMIRPARGSESMVTRTVSKTVNLGSN